MAKLVNVWGKATPLGVSRSSPQVAAAVAAALTEFCDVAAEHDAVGTLVARWAGAEAAALSHCSASAVTVAVAAALAGAAPDPAAALRRLPATDGLRRTAVLMPESHACVNYGAAIEQAARLAGASVRRVRAGEDWARPGEALRALLAAEDVAAVLAVDSQLVRLQSPEGDAAPSAAAVAAAARAHAPRARLIVDAAAQDLRARELVAELDADAVVFSAQKYLCGPTAGLLVGRADFVAAVRAQEAGIGRGMKTTKEALAGVRAAVLEREALPAGAVEARAAELARRAAAGVAALPGFAVREVASGGILRLEISHAALSGPEMRAALAERGVRARLGPGGLLAELTDCTEEEVDEFVWGLGDCTGRS